jgi:hypothetical protein
LVAGLRGGENGVLLLGREGRAGEHAVGEREIAGTQASLDNAEMAVEEGG